MRFSLRSLLIVMLLAGPLSAWGWSKWQTWQEHWEIQAELERFSRDLISRRQRRSDMMRRFTVLPTEP